MSQKKESSFPFSVVRSSRRTLVEQTVDGLKQCILSGVYKAGDVLPTTRELAGKLGVSRIVTLAAVRELTEAGLVNPRPGVGSVVLGGKGKLWKGRVLLVTRGRGSEYYANVFAAELRDSLIREGWLLTTVGVKKDGTDSFEFESQLTHPVDLAIVLFDNAAAERILSKSGVPFVSIGNGRKKGLKGLVGTIRYCSGTAAEEFAALCARQGVRHVEQIGIDKGCEEVLSALRAHIRDVGVSRVLVDVPRWCPAAVAAASRDWMRARLEKSKCRMPDAFFFADDFICEGALAAFAAVGVRVPEDVCVCTWANGGNEPVAARELTRLETTPVEDAKRVAAKALAFLRTREKLDDFDLGARFVPGETVVSKQNKGGK